MLRDNWLSLWGFSADAFEIFQSCDALLWYNPSEVVRNSLQPKKKIRKKKKHIKWYVLKSFERKVTYLFTEDYSAVQTHLFIEHQYLIIWLWGTSQSSTQSSVFNITIEMCLLLTVFGCVVSRTVILLLTCDRHKRNWMCDSTWCDLCGLLNVKVQ